MLSRKEQLKEWYRVVAMCKGTKLEGKGKLCVKARRLVDEPYRTYARLEHFNLGIHIDRIFAIAIVDDTPIWLEEPFNLYTKDKTDLVFNYDTERYGLVGVTPNSNFPNIKNRIKVFIPISNVIWENFTLAKPIEEVTDSSIQADPTKIYEIDTNDVDSKQVGGSHYKTKGIQPWAYMEANYTKEEFVGYLRGNAHKYLDRYKDKNGIEDLKKAIHYIEKLIEVEGK